MSEFIRPCALPSESKQLDRFEKIRSQFKTVYGREPAYFSRAPGRVNLIGEHIDYCGYAVLPMAIEQDIVIAASVNTLNKLRLANTDSQYESIEFDTNEFDIDKLSPKWFHYFLCGYRGMLEKLSQQGSIGIDLLLDGTIPKSSGLSSSSALVCCAALATMHAYEKQLSKLELAELCQHCERYIGTEGGGMDQSISFLAQHGTAKLIEFNPIRATDVLLPEGAVFVISNSCVEMNKAATDFFNVRVAECRLATQVLAKLKGLEWRKVQRLGDLEKLLGLTLDDMESLVKVTLTKDVYSKQDVCDLLEVTPDELNSISLSQRSRHVESFRLRDRAQHVYSEANRVRRFKAICESGEPGSLIALGDLMSESHRSCRDLYQCSCTDLDLLVDLALESGALGSRLTGAGWGGCAVSLVPSDSVESFTTSLREHYYETQPCRQSMLPQSLFVTQPGHGAAIYLV